MVEVAGGRWYKLPTVSRPTGDASLPAPFRRLFVALCAFLAFVAASVPANAIPLLLVDAQTGEVLYAEEAGDPWHPASLTKVMTAYVAFAAIQAGRVSLDTPVVISQNAWNQAPSKSGLAVGGRLTLRDALYIIIVKSANDVAVAIAETISGSVPAFVAEMNAMAQAMGMTATNFVNPHGLHAAAQVSSARDLAVLALYIRRDFPQYLPMFATEAVNLDGTVMETNNGLIGRFAGATGLKTGYVCASGLNIVATVERDGRSMIAVVLGGSSARERNELTAELILRGLSGALPGTGRSVLQIANAATPPKDMRPLICGKDSKAYVAAREAAFPIGLRGQPSYLTDRFPAPIHTATDLSGYRDDVPLPRRRPTYMPLATAAAQ